MDAKEKIIDALGRLTDEQREAIMERCEIMTGVPKSEIEKRYMEMIEKSKTNGIQKNTR